MGYTSFYLPDHFNEQLAPIAGIMAAADATSNLRIGWLVLDNDYRHPVVVAKEAATIDLLSDGRLDLGLGAGWLKVDYEQSGIPFDSAGTRIVWVQDEPENMGAWPFLRLRFGERLFGRHPLSCASREESASPATGSASAHRLEQQELVARAFAPL